MRWLCLLCVLLSTPASAGDSPAEDPRALRFDDRPLVRDVDHPEWFKLSFLNLRDDLEEALAAGRRGLMVYFGQKHCAYCQALMQVNFAKPDIVAYTRKHFDVVAIDIWGDREVTTLDGERLGEKQLAERERTNFTPSIVFYGPPGKEVFRLAGYYPPYQFRAALEYVADRHYERETFHEYLQRGEGSQRFALDAPSEEYFFSPPPYNFDRRAFPGQRPLLVFFEQGNCHPCDVLHGERLQDPVIRGLIEQFESAQLDLGADTPVVTPQGERLTARSWAQRLGLFYSPTLVFFGESGQEVMRVDSVVQFHRLHAVLEYILTRGYLEQPYFPRWREDRQAAGG
jgi:thioredoxin-related protein